MSRVPLGSWNTCQGLVFGPDRYMKAVILSANIGHIFGILIGVASYPQISLVLVDYYESIKKSIDNVK